MEQDVFISYSSKNKQTAGEICQILEQKKIKCWIAPRDILHGEEYGNIIPVAIKKARVFIIVFSEYAQLSRWVKSETLIAFDSGKIIIPFKIDETQPIGQMEMYLKGSHWIDAYPNIEQSYENLVKDVHALLLNRKTDLLAISKKKTNKPILYIVIFLALLSIIIYLSRTAKDLISTENTEIINAPNATIATTNINFKVNNNILYECVLTGNVEGYDYEIELNKDQQCIELTDQRDFDGDGLIDALICNIRACGGNAISNSFFFVSYGGTGYFKKSAEFGDCWNEPVIEIWNNQWSVIVESNNVGRNPEKKNFVKERYIFKDGKAVLVETMSKGKVAVLHEIKASVFHNGNENEEKYIYFDLDGDNKQDVIVCTYWDRWDSIFWEVRFGNGITTAPSLGCDRIGILDSKTNGVNNIVCGSDDVLTWNGKEYLGKD